MIYSNKTLDAAIAIAGALSDITSKSKDFKENLHTLVEQKALTDAAIIALKQEHDDQCITLSELNVKLTSSKVMEEKLAKDLADSLNAIDDLAIIRVDIDTKTQENSERAIQLDIATESLSEKLATFLKTSQDKLLELEEREAALKIKEDHVEEIRRVMSQ